MKHKIVFLVSLTIISLSAFAQPGPYGTNIKISFVSDAGEVIYPGNGDFEIKWITSKSVLVSPTQWGTVPDTLTNVEYSSKLYGNDHKEALYFHDSVYIVDVIKTPAGGGIKSGAHFLVLDSKKDTMRLYPPVGYFGYFVELEKMKFRKGNYEIDPLVYTFHSSLKPEFRRLFRPNMYDDWELFRVENEDVPYQIMYAENMTLYGNYKNYSEAKRILENEYKSSVLENGSSKAIFNKYFDEKTLDYELRSLMVICDASERMRQDIPFNFFGVFPDFGGFICQKEEGGNWEYGYIYLPVKAYDTIRSKSNGLTFDTKNEAINQNRILNLPINIIGIDPRPGDKTFEFTGYFYNRLIGTEGIYNAEFQYGEFRLHLTELSKHFLEQLADKHTNMIISKFHKK